MPDKSRTGLLVRLDNDELFFFSEEFLEEHRDRISVTSACYGSDSTESLHEHRRLLDKLNYDVPALHGVRNALYAVDRDLTDPPQGGDDFDGSRPGKPLSPALDSLGRSARPSPTTDDE